MHADPSTSAISTLDRPDDAPDARSPDRPAPGRTGGWVSAAVIVASIVISRPGPRWIDGVLVAAGALGTAVGVLAGRRRRSARANGERRRRARSSATAAPGASRSARVRSTLWGWASRLAVATAVTAVLLAFGAWPAVALLPGLFLGLAAAFTWRTGPPALRWRRWLPLLPACALLPIVWSVERTMTAPGPDPLEIRAVEWLRDHGGAGAVNAVEHWWYTSHPPPVGGTPAELTHPSGAAPASQPVARSLPRVPSPVATPLGNEGVWTVTAGTAERPAVATTLVRPDAVHTGLVVGLIRIDPRLVQLRLVPGTEQPGGIPGAAGDVAPADRGRLVAAFNAGFRMTEANGGWFANGRTARPLVSGAASLVLRDDGRCDVGAWGRDDTMDAHVIGVRQNLQLLVDGGRPVPQVTDESSRRWGATLGNKVLVWRSGIGVTADGDLIYAGGPALSVETLAKTLAAAGSVRAMELDINTSWVDGYTFRPGPAGPVGTKLLADMRYPVNHYLATQSRDFVEALLP